MTEEEISACKALKQQLARGVEAYNLRDGQSMGVWVSVTPQNTGYDEVELIATGLEIKNDNT